MFNIFLMVIGIPIINEVMANPMGTESGSGSPGDRNEFVEIYNLSDSPVDMANYFLADRMETDEIVPFPDSSITELYPGTVVSTVIPPGGYGLILDREYMEEGNGQYPQPYEIPSGAVLMSTGDTDIGNGLSNSDSLWLIGPGGVVVDIYPAPVRPPDGVSVERREPENDIWMLSRSGCTPGYRNSVYVLIDLAVVPQSFHIDPSFPIPGDDVELSFKVLNYGIDDIQGFWAFVANGSDTNRFYIDSVIVSYDTVDVRVFIGNFDLSGFFTLSVGVRCENDEDTSNDAEEIGISIGVSPVVINEISYSGAIEWVELYNRGETPFPLDRLAVVDRAGNRSDPISDSIYLQPHGYIVLSGDTSFRTAYPGVDCLCLSEFPSLNNNGDDVMLMEASGILLDSVPYTPSWGGRDGRSIERISPEIAGWEKYNWSESESPDGATPGAPNSVSHIVEPPEGKLFAIQKTALNPHRGDELVVTYHTNAIPLKITIKIYDETGWKCMEVTRERPAQKGEVVVDISDLEDGLYILYFALAASNGRTYRGKQTFSVIRE